MHIFKKLFGNRNAAKGVVGVSFLTEGIAVAVANVTPNDKPRLMHCAFLHTSALHESPNILRKLVTDYKLNDYDCHLILPANEYRRINIETPNVAEEELTDAIRWKIADLIDYPVSEAALDFYAAASPIRSSERKFSDIVVCPRLLIEQKAIECAKNNLNLKVIDIQETSLRNLAILLPENKRGVAILHLQENSGTILIQKDGTIYLSRQLDIGYKKLNFNADLDDEAESSLENNTITLEIQRSLDYIENYYGLPPISSVAVIPIGLHSQGLLNILNNTRSITARILDISAIIDCDIVLDDDTQCYCAPVIGTTLRQVLKTE